MIFNKEYAFKHLLGQLKSNIDSLLAENNELSKKISEYSKDAEIESMEKELRHIRRNSLQNLTDKEYDTLCQFRNSHYESCRATSMRYTISGTGIGTCTEVECPVCGNTVDITDYGAW